MKKLIGFLLIAIMSSAVYAAKNVVPRTEDGSQVATFNSIGAKYKQVSLAVTETAGVAGAQLLYGVITSSAPAESYIVISDSTTSVTGTAAVANIYPTTTSTVYSFPVPIRLSLGSTVRSSEASAVGKITLIYLLNSEK